MSDYAYRPGGALKFKGQGEKKKKKKSHPSSSKAKGDAEIAQAAKDKAGQASQSTPESGGRRLTESERRFQEVQSKRREERAKKNALLSHKERVSEYNAKLERLSEHHDMPKIGPG